MRSLAAAISPGYFGFTDWAFAAEPASEIAVQVPIATRKNNALLIISSHVLHSRGCAQSVRPLGPAWSRSKPLAVLEPREDATRQVRRQAAGKPQGLSSLHDSCRGSIGNAFFMLVNPSLRILWRAASCSANNQTPHFVKDRRLTALNHKSQWRLCRSWSST